MKGHSCEIERKFSKVESALRNRGPAYLGIIPVMRPGRVPYDPLGETLPHLKRKVYLVRIEGCVLVQAEHGVSGDQRGMEKAMGNVLNVGENVKGRQ